MEKKPIRKSKSEKLRYIIDEINILKEKKLTEYEKNQYRCLSRMI